MDIGLHHGPSTAQRAPAGHRAVRDQLDHAVMDLRQRLRADRLGPADQGGVVWDGLEGEAAKLLEHETIADEVFRRCVAPTGTPFDDEQAEDGFHRRAMPTVGQAMRTAPGEVGFDALEDGIVLEQVVEFTQLGLEVGQELGHQLKEVDRVVTIHDHTAVPPGIRCCFTFILSLEAAYFAPQTNISYRCR